jgi:hypothetical protein
MENTPSDAPPEKLTATFSTWLRAYKSDLQEKRDMYPVDVLMQAADAIGRSALTWCRTHGQDSDGLSAKLWDVQQFVPALYDALHPRNGSATKLQYLLWQHIDVPRFLTETAKSSRENVLDRESLKICADIYLRQPWLRNAYIGWIFIDALMLGEFLATYDWLQSRRWGISYTIFDGNKNKALFFKLIAVPATFFLGWILPGLLCWWLFSSYPTAALIAAALYYGTSLAWLVFRVCRYVLQRLRGAKSFTRVSVEMINAMSHAYFQLREDTIHVPSLKQAVQEATEKGVAWDPQLLCVLDDVAQEHPIAWARAMPPRSYIV